MWRKCTKYVKPVWLTINHCSNKKKKHFLPLYIEERKWAETFVNGPRSQPTYLPDWLTSQPMRSSHSSSIHEKPGWRKNGVGEQVSEDVSAAECFFLTAYHNTYSSRWLYTEQRVRRSDAELSYRFLSQKTHFRATALKLFQACIILMAPSLLIHPNAYEIHEYPNFCYQNNCYIIQGTDAIVTMHVL